MHVPLKSKVDDGLSDASKAAWQDRATSMGSRLLLQPG